MNPATAMQNGGAHQGQMVSRDYRGQTNAAQFQNAPQFQIGPVGQPAETAPNWTLPVTDRMGDQKTDHDNSSVQAVAAPAEVARTPVETAAGTVQTQVSPPTPQIESKSTGWRPAITPLPATLVQHQTAASDGVAASQQPFQQNASTANAPTAAEAPLKAPSIDNAQASSTGGQPAAPNPTAFPAMQPLELARRSASDSTVEFPNISVRPLPDMPPPMHGLAKTQTAGLDREPVPFTLPGSGNERQLPPPAPPAEPAGVVELSSQVPPTLSLTPRAVPRTTSLRSEQEAGNSILDREARLAKQTDDIRIIPNERGVGHSRLESLLSTGPSNESTSPDAASDPLTSGWKSYMAPSPRPQLGSDVLPSNASPDTATQPNHENSPAQGRAHSDSLVTSGDAGQSRPNQIARPSQPTEEKAPEPRPVFDLGSLLKDPEFREIHSRPVLDALELLAQHETRHRLLGALRIGVLGSDARTALPALRQFLAEEPSQIVRLRVAEGILRLLPNDRVALETLSHSLIDPNDAELRQAAAGALGGASAAGNPTAIVRLTDALDDPVPKVRIMAALSLAQFGPAAIDAIPRLELAASNDVPRMQRAALAALASIRVVPGYQDSESTLSPTADSRTTAPQAAARATNNVAFPPRNFEGPIGPSPFAEDNSPIRGASPPAAFPDLKEKPASIHTIELKGTSDGSGRSQLWQTIPARGISLHEIDSDGPSAEAKSHHSAEPSHLPDVVARPVERVGQPATEAAKAPITPAPPITPLSNDSPLNLEPQSGTSKPGSSE